ncbi:MAG: hypothetical protein Q4A01_05455 [Coriobacteriales bacterium]|nr:hypothetical protein [Coriobacteriales bacterium]
MSHTSALYATRMLRAENHDLRLMDYTPLAAPAPWVGNRWSVREFYPAQWRWPRPAASQPLNVLVPSSQDRLRVKHVTNHTCSKDLPPTSILWLDNNASMVSPPLLFVQMAQTLTIPELVLLGYELCGCFTRDARKPTHGPTTDMIPPATSVDEVLDYLYALRGVPGATKAREALQYVSNFALSPPEAVLATMYSLPVAWSGYDMGPVALNQRVSVAQGDVTDNGKDRYPDLMFPFAPIGINYDGNDHLRLGDIVQATHAVDTSSGAELENAKLQLQEATQGVRAKYVDDLRRNRELMSRGCAVLPLIKEDLYDSNNLDTATRQILQSAQSFFGVDVQDYLNILDDPSLKRQRSKLLRSLLHPQAT